MKLFINSTPVETSANNIEQLIEENKDKLPSNIALALNGTLIHAQKWREQKLTPNDRLDVFSAAAGG